MSAELVKSILQKGDAIMAYGHSRSAQLTGEVKSIGRVNAKIYSRIRFAPDGPWHDQEHVVPLHEINVIVRDGKVLLDLRKKR